MIINTLASRLGSAATRDVMEAFVHLFAYMMKFMLPPAIESLVIETEMNIKTSSAFAEGRVFAEVQQIEEIKDVNKKLKKREKNSSSNSGSARSGIATNRSGAETNRSVPGGGGLVNGILFTLGHLLFEINSTGMMRIRKIVHWTVSLDK